MQDGGIVVGEHAVTSSVNDSFRNRSKTIATRGPLSGTSPGIRSRVVTSSTLMSGYGVVIGPLRVLPHLRNSLISVGCAQRLAGGLWQLRNSNIERRWITH